MWLLALGVVATVTLGTMLILPKYAETVATIGGFFIALVALSLTAFEVFGRTDVPSSPADLADDFALKLREQWLDEAEARGLRGPEVLALSWTTTEQNVSGTLPARGTRRPRVIRMRLNGRPEGRFEDATAQLAGGYARVPNRRLVVVGEPGSGKTVLALLLTVGLLNERADGGPVPVLLPVSSWDPAKEDLEPWLIRTTAEPYYNGRQDILRRLLREGLLVPVLDGLDEMPDSARRMAMDRLSRIRAGRPVVVTCRAAEYEELIRDGAPTLKDATVVRVLPVAPDDVITYLRGVDWPAGTDWSEVFTHLRAAPESPLSLALSTPLMVSSARLVYQRRGGNPAALMDPRLNSRYAVENHLMKAMVAAAYAPDASLPEANRPPQRWTAEQADRWLAFLARYLHERDERDLAWWHLSGRYLTRWTGPVTGLVMGALVALAAVLWETLTMKGDERAASSDTFLAAVVIGVCFALVCSIAWFASAEPPPGRLTWSVRDSAGRLAQGFRTGTGVATLLVTPVVGIVFTAFMIDGESSRGLDGLESFASVGGVAVATVLTVGLALAVHKWLDAPPLNAAEVSPALLLAQDRRSSIVSAGVAGALVALIGIPAVLCGLFAGDLIVRVMTNWAGWPPHADIGLLLDGAGSDSGDLGFSWRMVGLAVLLPTGFSALILLMSRAWPRFQMVRVRLAIRGELPWRLMAFLADARQREILRQAGGVYQFRHIRLQHTLAGARPDSDEAGRESSGTRRRVVLGLAVGALALGFAGSAWRYRDTSRSQFADPRGRTVKAVRFLPDGGGVAILLDGGAMGVWSGAEDDHTWNALRKGASSDFSFSALAVVGDDDTLVAQAIRDGKPVSGHMAAFRLDSGTPDHEPEIIPGHASRETFDHLVVDPKHGYLAANYQASGVVVLAPDDRGVPSFRRTRELDLLASDRSGSFCSGMDFAPDGDLAVLVGDTLFHYTGTELTPPEEEASEFAIPMSLPAARSYKTKVSDPKLNLNYTDFGNSVAISPKNKTLALFGPLGTEFRLWSDTDARWGDVASTLPAMRTGRFHPSLPMIAVAEYHGEGRTPAYSSDEEYTSGVVRIYRIGPWAKLTLRRTLHGHGAPVVTMDFHADGSRLVTGDMDGTVRIWDM
ncbi:NACHT domain-containing protein [Streptomyces griseus]|uniref:NACHT domain-containing protein n=2 Tax=Streptomyces griseus TaxID=1911 RepID=UPI0033B23D4B